MLQIGTTGAVSFDQPLALLRACHEKILQQCITLEKLAAHLLTHGNDAPAQQAAQGILRYFATAGQFHHLDEEENLFPLLRQAQPEVQGLLAQLETEHVGMLAAWAAVQAELQQLLVGELPQLSADKVMDFTQRYRAHVALENAQVLPLAEGVLSVAAQQEIGRAMMARRGVRQD